MRIAVEIEFVNTTGAMEDTLLTNEDRMIARLHVPRNLITWMLQRLTEAGIKAKRTTGNDPRGDIVLSDPKDVPRVQEIIRAIQREKQV